jgi:acyl-homoserine lactone acylase PvdQ
MPMKSVFVVLCAASVSFLSAGSIHAKTSKPNYNAQVLRTSYGIPHIQATDWGSLGYGYGYAFAEDNVCVMAREVLAANGTQSRYFGGGTVNSDRVYKMVNSAARVSAAWGVLDIETRDLLTGYAAGYNRYLRDTDPAALPADCRSQPWVQAIAGEDVLKVLRKLLVRAGTGNFVAALVAATPPPAVAALGVDGSPETMLAGAVATDEALAAIDPRRVAGLQRRALRQQCRRPRPRPDRRRRRPARQPALPVVRHRTLLRRAPDDPRALRRHGRLDLRLPAGQHRLQPQPRLEPHGLDRPPLRAA